MDERASGVWLSPRHAIDHSKGLEGIILYGQPNNCSRRTSAYSGMGLGWIDLYGPEKEAQEGILIPEYLKQINQSKHMINTTDD
jgi:hypothetical protein